MLLAASNLWNLNHTQLRAALSGHSGCRNRTLLGGSYDLRTPMRLLYYRIKIVCPCRWHLSLTSNIHREEESLTLLGASVKTMDSSCRSSKGEEVSGGNLALQSAVLSAGDGRGSLLPQWENHLVNFLCLWHQFISTFTLEKGERKKILEVIF